MRKCGYCDFCSVGIGDGDVDLTGRMVECLVRELGSQADARVGGLDEVSTVFIGGGTPSLLPVAQMERLLRAIRDTVGTVGEFTIECNPGTVDEDKLRLFRDYGVNRLSIGCQSLQDEELASLGRIHDRRTFLESYELARRVGFDNINIDLMTAIPGQTTESLRATLDEAIRLAPEHISAYSLIIEEGTPFYDRYQDRPPADEDTDRAFYFLTEELLTRAGYEHYEISNYAKPGYACEHNLNYWRRGSYIGIGPAAASFDSDDGAYGSRKTNTRDMQRYMEAVESGDVPTAETELLTEEQADIEKLYLSLRTSDGLGPESWYTRHPELREAWDKVWETCRREGLIVSDDDRVRLTGKGFFLIDSIVGLLMKECD